MKDKLSLSDRTSFSRLSHRFKMDCISEGIDGVRFLSFASAILNQRKIQHKVQFYHMFKEIGDTIKLSLVCI